MANQIKIWMVLSGHAFAFCLGKAKVTIGSAMFFWHAGSLFTLSISMCLLLKATQTLPIGTVQVVWTGIGAVFGTVLIGLFVFKEPTNLLRLFVIMTLIASIVGLKAVSHKNEEIEILRWNNSFSVMDSNQNKGQTFGKKTGGDWKTR